MLLHATVATLVLVAAGRIHPPRRPALSAERDALLFACEDDDIGRVRDGMVAGAHFVASDGVGLWFERIDYRSSEAAVSSMNGYLSGAVQVVERGEAFDDTGGWTGEYAVAVFACGGERRTQVMWTDGKFFELVDGPTLRHALGLEALLQRAQRVATYRSGLG